MEFIRLLPSSSKAKALRTINLLEEFGHHLGMPHSKFVAPNVFELRTHGAHEIRLLYTFHRQTAVILHAYIKKSEKMPMKELALAIERKKALERK